MTGLNLLRPYFAAGIGSRHRNRKGPRRMRQTFSARESNADFPLRLRGACMRGMTGFFVQVERIELCCAHRSPLLKAFPAEYRASLRGPERHRGFLPALRAAGPGFRTHWAAVAAARCFGALGFAAFAALGLILEAFIGEEHLFSAGKYKLGATLRALQDLIVIFHGSVPPETPVRRNAQNLHDRPHRTAKKLWDRGTGWAPWACKRKLQSTSVHYLTGA